MVSNEPRAGAGKRHRDLLLFGFLPEAIVAETAVPILRPQNFRAGYETMGFPRTVR